MTLLQMRYFLTVCRLQNITHAAAELHVAQSTLSQAMQALEEETGLNLFLRTGRHIMMSQDGQRLAQKLSRLLAQVDAVEREVEDMAHRHQRVRIAIPQQQAAFLMPRLLRVFQPAHPEVVLDVIEPYGIESARLVRDEKADIAVVNSDEQSLPELRYRRIASHPICLTVWEGHPLAARGHISLAEAARIPLAMLSEEFYVTRCALRAMDTRGLAPDVRYFSPHLSTLYSLVRQHALPAILYERALAELPGLVALPFDEDLRLTGTILTKKSRQSTRDQRLVIQFIAQQLAAAGDGEETAP
ncbi:LysR family transcriptional regulator [Selenomonas bovis]|nr:LysR family transcriptional regulator [Selenomonas bovis]